MTIIEVYEKYKHLDKILCDSAFVDSLQTQDRYDMWQAIRAAGQGESAPTDVQQANTTIALAERYCDSSLSHSAEERMTMLRFTMWVREQQQ